MIAMMMAFDDKKTDLFMSSPVTKTNYSTSRCMEKKDKHAGPDIKKKLLIESRNTIHAHIM